MHPSLNLHQTNPSQETGLGQPGPWCFLGSCLEAHSWIGLRWFGSPLAVISQAGFSPHSMYCWQTNDVACSVLQEQQFPCVPGPQRSAVGLRLMWVPGASRVEADLLLWDDRSWIMSSLVPVSTRKARHTWLHSVLWPD